MNTLPRDPVILVSVLNTKLRDFYPSLDALCSDLNTDRADLESRCGAIGYKYSPNLNQFIQGD